MYFYSNPLLEISNIKADDYNYQSMNVIIYILDTITGIRYILVYN